MDQLKGEEKQRQQQTALDEAFRQYQLERNYPYDTMGQYQAVVTGAPVRPTTFAKPADPTPSIGQQLIGGIGTLGAAYGAFTGNNPLDLIRRKGGGGLDTLPIVYRQTPGQILNYYDLNFAARDAGQDTFMYGQKLMQVDPGYLRGGGINPFISNRLPAGLQQEVIDRPDLFRNITNLNTITKIQGDPTDPGFYSEAPYLPTQDFSKDISGQYNYQH